MRWEMVGAAYHVGPATRAPMPASPPDPSRGYVRARIAARADHTPDLAVFRLELETPLHFQPGQYATLALPGADGRLVKRPYSIASAPHEPQIELFVERVEGGALTPQLWSHAVGDEVFVRQRVAGQFLLEKGDDGAPQRHVFCATVTGIAPFCSMLRAYRHALANGDAADHRFLVLLAASAPDDFGPYADEMAIFGREPYAQTVVAVSRPWAAPAWTGETGRIEDVLRKHLDGAGFRGPDVTAYACGNPDMIANVRGVLRRSGFVPEQIREEEYFHADAATPETASPPIPAAAPPSGRRPGEVVLKAAAPPADA